MVVRDMTLGGIPRLYIDVLGRLRREGLRVGLASAGGDLDEAAREAGIEQYRIDWDGSRVSSYAAVAEAARGYDAAIVLCDPELLHTIPAAIGGAGRGLMAVHSHLPGLSDWFGEQGLPALERMARALVALPCAGIVVRGPVAQRAIAGLLGIPADELVPIEQGTPIEEIEFDPPRTGDRSIMVLTRLAPETLDRVRAAVVLTAAARAEGRDLHLRVVGDGPSREQALDLCRAELPDGTWRHEPATYDPVGSMRASDWVVATGLTALLAAAAGCVVATARRTGDGRGALGPPLTPELYDEVAGDLLASSPTPWAAADVWRELWGMDRERLAAVRARVESRSSSERQKREFMDALAGLEPSPDAQAIELMGAIAAAREQEWRDQVRVGTELWEARSWYEEQLQALAEVRRTADELWEARSWYEGQIAALRERLAERDG